MIEIKLDENIWLTSDERQYMLAKKRPNGVFANFSFHTSLDSALRSYVERRIRLSDAKSIAELRKFLSDLLEGLNKALQPLKIRIEKLHEEIKEPEV